MIAKSWSRVIRGCGFENQPLLRRSWASFLLSEKILAYMYTKAACLGNQRHPLTYVGRTEGGNQSCPEASIPDLAVRIIRLFEQSSLGFSESKLTLVFP